MQDKAVLLIGGLTHANPEWQALSAKYSLKVCLIKLKPVIGANCDRNTVKAQGRSLGKNSEMATTIALLGSIGQINLPKYAELMLPYVSENRSNLLGLQGHWSL